MALTAITETGHGPEFLLSEAPGNRSRDTVTFAVSQTISAGEVLGKTDEGVKTGVAAAGVPAPAGATISAVVCTLDAQPGVHRLVCITAGATGKFDHIGPGGDQLGTATTGTAYTGGGLTLTITDSGTDPAVGEEFTVTVSEAAATVRWKTHDPEAVDGTQVAAGIAYQAVTTAADETVAGVVITRDAEVINGRLVWDDQSADEKTAAKLQLAALGIIVRS